MNKHVEFFLIVALGLGLAYGLHYMMQKPIVILAAQ